jgi:hypothetical protein
MCVGNVTAVHKLTGEWSSGDGCFGGRSFSNTTLWTRVTIALTVFVARSRRAATQHTIAMAHEKLQSGKRRIVARTTALVMRINQTTNIANTTSTVSWVDRTTHAALLNAHH